MAMTTDRRVTADEGGTEVPIAGANDVILARQKGRVLAERLGFSGTDVTLIATAISEVARNIVEHAGEGVVRLSIVSDGVRAGLLVVAEDTGPGIQDLEQALRDDRAHADALAADLFVTKPVGIEAYVTEMRRFRDLAMAR